MILAKIYEQTQDKYKLGLAIQEIYLDNYGNYKMILDLINFFENTSKIDTGLKTLLLSLAGHPLITDYLILNKVFGFIEKFNSRKYMLDFYNSININKNVNIELLNEKLRINKEDLNL